jgi:hypothetical protein
MLNIGEIAPYAGGSKDLADVLKRIVIYQKATRCHLCGGFAAVESLDGLFKHGKQICLVCSSARYCHETVQLTARRCI